jgi:arylsulfatase
VKESPRKEFLYWSDDGDLFAIRVQNWKIVFIENNATGLAVWESEFTRLRVPNIFNLLTDPFERGTTSFLYPDWKAHRAFMLVPAQAIVAQWLESFKEFPIRQRPASFNLDEVMRKLTPTQ